MGSLRRVVPCALCALAVIPGTAMARTIAGTPGKDRLVGRAHETNTISGDGGGDDIVYAYSKDPVRIDCGRGTDTVRIGNNRHVSMRHCEKTVRL